MVRLVSLVVATMVATTSVHAEGAFRRLAGTPVNCVAYTVANDPGPWSACIRTAGGWFKSKVLGIQTPAQNGGTACAGEDLRRVRVACTPVNCVVYRPEEDPNEFTACELEADGWFKYKTLGIKTQPLYGGTRCPDTSARLYRERCAPQNCVANSPDEDTGSFGACQQESDGWYKSKTLGVKYEALYGGTCVAAARQYKTRCVPTCNPIAPHNDIGAEYYYETSVTAKSTEDCCEACRLQARCLSYVFYSYSGRCWIQSAMRSSWGSTGTFSGTISYA